MGCCNKVHVGKPIPKARYVGGLAVLAGAQLGMLAATCAVAVARPRYRKVLRFQVEYARDVLRSAWRRERICVEGLGGGPGSACSWDQGTP